MMPDSAPDAVSTGWFLRAPAASRSRPTLYCLPYAGAAASVYRDWPRALADIADVAPVQLPGRENRIAEQATVDPRAIADAIVSDSTHPCVLFGHSMGALVAYEVAAELTSRGQHALLSQLFVSGAVDPLAASGIWLADNPTDVELTSWLRQQGGTASGVLHNPALLDLILPAVRADWAWLAAYPGPTGPRLRCPITAFVGEQDPDVDSTAAAHWAAHTDGPFRLHVLPGGHFFLREARAALFAQIRASLAGESQ
jgi:surfactin synthase thioesterase subunit